MSVSQSTLTFDKAFRGKYAALANKIDTSHGLMNQLLDKDVLTNHQISSIQVLYSPVFLLYVSEFSCLVLQQI